MSVAAARNVFDIETMRGRVSARIRTRCGRLAGHDPAAAAGGVGVRPRVEERSGTPESRPQLEELRSLLGSERV